jgi:hypothetical protein
MIAKKLGVATFAMYHRRKCEEGTEYEEILKEFNVTKKTVWLTAQTRCHWVDRKKT